MYPDNSYGSGTLSAQYNQTELYNAFCEQSLSTQYDIANAAGVQDVDSCGFGAGSGTNSYVVTYDLQGGSWGATPTTQTVTYGSSWSIIFDSYPSKSGYTFGGFYTSANCGGTKYVNAGSSSDWQLTSARNWDKTSNTTLYACWISNTTYTITLDMQGGSVGTTNLTISAKYGQPFTYIYNTYPAKSGYTYGGFYTGTNCTGTQYIGVDSPSTYQLSSIRNWDKASNTTLYACWRSESGNDHNLTCADIYEFYDNGGPRCWDTHNDMIICGFEVEVCMEKEMWRQRDAFCADGIEYTDDYASPYALSSAVRSPLEAASELGLDCSTYESDDGSMFADLAAQQAMEQSVFGAVSSWEDAVCETFSELYNNCADTAVPANDTNNPLWWNYETCSSNTCTWVLSAIGTDVREAIWYAKQNYASSSRETQASQAADYIGYNCSFAGIPTCPTTPMTCSDFDDLYGEDLENRACPDSANEIGGWIAEMGPNLGHSVIYAQRATELYNTYCTKCNGNNTGTVTGCYKGDIATALGLNAQSCGFATSAAYSLNYSSISDAMTQAEEDGYLNCYGDQGGNGPVLVHCDCRSSVTDLIDENEFLYEINMPSYAQTNCPTSGVPASAMADLSCSLSGTYNDYSWGRVLCVSQDIVNAATDGCADLCGCGNPWTQETAETGESFYRVGENCNQNWCNVNDINTSYIHQTISFFEPDYDMYGCVVSDQYAIACAANMYVDLTNPDDGGWCSSCPSYTLADGTTVPGSLAALTQQSAITQCTVPTTSVLRGTNGNYKYRNACAYTE